MATTNATANQHIDTVAKHEDTGKHAGNAAEQIAKQAGFGKYGKKINDFIKKLVTKKQKEIADKKGKESTAVAPAENATPAPAAAPATATA